VNATKEQVKQVIREMIEDSKSQYFMRRDVQLDLREKVIDELYEEFIGPLLVRLARHDQTR
jgi:hypothetical protein